MEWLERLNDAMAYVEEHLTGEITLEGAAQRAACSAYHFQRMFPYVAGVSFSEYVRRRRMTAAAMDLAGGEERVIDVAARYGYESPTAFNRAFQSVHGLPPKAARVRGAQLKAFPPITFTLSIKGEEAMEFQIVEREGFRVVGFATKESMTMEDCFEKVPLFWKQVSGDIPRLLPLMDGGEPRGVLGVSACDGGEFSGYYIGVATGQAAPEGMEACAVPAGTWAVFPCVGPMPQAMQALQQRIISEWLPASGYEYAAAPDIEVYFPGDQTAPGYRSEVWLPITPAKKS
ncbi:AraC family transcriptional regulator [uncultured Oscillibacter sp.]|uniref:AraC family transcriptional regulator n=1 Tax=uncultured Oscillibacter sp. TaxID=876091 RepID=UPI0025F0B292|nr:AraC family transcriptional regulator [uncultured Oscillibacter sp.]